MNFKLKSPNSRRPNIFYGWYIAIIAGLGLFFSGPGQTFSISIFIDSYIQHFGWSRSFISGIYSSATLLSGVCLLYIGFLIDRFGQRKMMISVGILLTLTCMLNSQVDSPWQLFIGFFFIRLLGQGCMTLIPSTLVPRWFFRQRGRALSIMALGLFLSSTTVPPLNHYLIHEFGWQFAWMIWGFLVLLIFIPITTICVRDTPEEFGLLSDNDPIVNPKDGLLSSKEKSWTLKQAMRTWSFWIILYFAGISALVNTAIVFHLPPILVENGLSTNIAPILLSVMAVVGFPITFLVGYAVDKIKINYIILISFLSQLFFLVMLIQAQTFTMIIILSLIWGIQNGIEQVVLNMIWPHYFGKTYLGSIRGVAMVTVVISSSAGPLLYGLAFDFFNSYKEIIYITTMLPLIALLLP